MRHFGTKSMVLALLAFLGLAVAAPEARAQMGDDTWDMRDNNRFSVSFFAGGFSPLGDLGQGEFDSSVTVGGTADIWFTRHVGVRGNIIYAHSEPMGLPDAQVPFTDPNHWFYNADVVLRAPMSNRHGWFSPYLLGGLGVKAYYSDTETTETTFAGNYGAGIEYRLPDARWGFRAEVRDFVSSFNVGTFDDMQHDLIWTAGISVNF